MDEGADEGAEEIRFTALDVNPDDLRAVVSELITSETSLKKLNKKLQQSLDLVEGQNSELHHESMALTCQMKLLRQAVDEEKKLWEELQHRKHLMANSLWYDPQEHLEDCPLSQLSVDKQREDLHEKWMIIKYLSSSIQKQLTTIQELETKKEDLAVQLEKDMMNPMALLDIMSMQLCTQHTWEQLHFDVQHSAVLAHNSVLHTENMILCNQLESHRQTLDETEKLYYELKDVCRDAAEMEGTIHTDGKHISKLKIENRVLRAQCDTTNREMSAILSESQKKTSKIDELVNTQRALQQQLEEEYQLFFAKNSQDLDENWMIHKQWETSIKEHLTIIQELKTKNRHLEVQLEKAMVLGGPHVSMCLGGPLLSKKDDLERLPHVYVEFSNVEEEHLDPEEERDQEPELHAIQENDLWWMGPVVDGQSGQTKSWWRRAVKKVVKGMGTFRQHLKGCLGIKTTKKPVARVINVQHVNSTIIAVNIDKSVSV